MQVNSVAEYLTLVQIEGVNCQAEAVWYAGKRMAFFYRAKVMKNGSYYHCIWGKVSRPHRNSGTVRAKFKSSLPPKYLGVRMRVFMYPMPAISKLGTCSLLCSTC
ncbi:putative ribosomal protein L35A [Rosa chinensis]|uniref:Putative ribosomal protein L35A n=1 Tax=Rosa chinensis TaxID=74649 RepID=A0A2P6Q6P4_ROSCH|nr:putative ribosomal protein L35A [Rosa chinensis]